MNRNRKINYSGTTSLKNDRQLHKKWLTPGQDNGVKISKITLNKKQTELFSKSLKILKKIIFPDKIEEKKYNRGKRKIKKRRKN